MTIASTNPSNGQLIRTFAELSPAEIEQRLARAQRAFPAWAGLGFVKRAALLRGLAARLRQDAQRLGALMTLEMGKPIAQARAEIEKCAWVCEFYAAHGAEFLPTRAVATDAAESYVRYDPLGIVLAIMPWNFPFWQIFRFAAPALLAGNAALLKHASNVPQCAMAIEDLFRDCRFPDGVFTNLLISAATAETLIAHPAVAAVTLTGSETAGRRVAAAAGAALKKSVLELGGSDPFIVLDDADLERAAAAGAQARTINAGQSCIAAKRFIVLETVAKPFLQLFKAQLRQLKVGDPLDETTAIGPLARGDLRFLLHDQITRSVTAGARLELGGEIPAGRGYFYPVTLLTQVRPEMPVAAEETFGPVAPVLVVETDAEAVRLANASPYGLGASLWTQNQAKARRIAGELEAGVYT
ncbi:MAG: aldehyde dehydrogenase family protein [Myxococcales bacterium]|nr:aldehyde dehydrogenase family protein [Myxococcales bacterium]